MTPETLVFQVTTRCPYTCPQCYMQRGTSDLPPETGKRIIDYALPLGLQAIQITGGEPLAYYGLFELIEYAHSKGLITLLATSGYRHSPELYLRLKECGLDALCVSLNDIDESVNALTRDSYEDSILAMRDAQEVGLLCLANAVISDLNIQNLEVLACYLSRFDVERVDLLRPLCSFDGKYIPKISDKTIEMLHNIVSKNPDRFRVENCFREYWEYVEKKAFVCQDAGHSTFFINANGMISPCSKLLSFQYRSVEELLHHQDQWKGGCCN